MKNVNDLGRFISLAAILSIIVVSLPARGADEVVYFQNDALGSAIAAFNENGDLCWEQSYTPYGEQTSNQDVNPPSGCGLIDKDRGFTGHVQDTSGLVYMQQRYYDPSVGRFLSIDPLEPDLSRLPTLNRYSYAANNPYRYVDPDGRDYLDEFFENFDDASTESEFIEAFSHDAVEIAEETGREMKESAIQGCIEYCDDAAALAVSALITKGTTSILAPALKKRSVKALEGLGVVETVFALTMFMANPLGEGKSEIDRFKSHPDTTHIENRENMREVKRQSRMTRLLDALPKVIGRK